MPGGVIDDPDMRVGFAISRLFAKRPGEVRYCSCGKPMGRGQLARTKCDACRSARAEKQIDEAGLARIRLDLRRQERRAKAGQPKQIRTKG